MAGQEGHEPPTRPYGQSAATRVVCLASSPPCRRFLPGTVTWFFPVTLVITGRTYSLIVMLSRNCDNQGRAQRRLAPESFAEMREERSDHVCNSAVRSRTPLRMARAEELIWGTVWYPIRISCRNVEDVQLPAWLKQVLEAMVVFRAARCQVRRGMTNNRTLPFEIQHRFEKLFRSLLVEKASHLVVARGRVPCRCLSVPLSLAIPAERLPLIVVRTEPSPRPLSGE